MRVRTVGGRLAGPPSVARPGAVVDLPPPLARQLVAGGYAVYVDAAGGNPQVETTEAPPAPEHALSPRGQRKKR